MQLIEFSPLEKKIPKHSGGKEFPAYFSAPGSSAPTRVGRNYAPVRTVYVSAQRLKTNHAQFI